MDIMLWLFCIFEGFNEIHGIDASELPLYDQFDEKIITTFR